jgi:hypothetical protein
MFVMNITYARWILNLMNIWVVVEQGIIYLGCDENQKKRQVALWSGVAGPTQMLAEP